MSEPLVLRVSDFVAILNQTLEYAYPSVIIEGELSDFRVSRGKWVYFDIKDEFSSVRCFGTVYMLPGPLEDGMMVRIAGAPRLHPKYNFSITVSQIEPAGQGSLKRAYDLLLAKLSAEGLFDAERKRLLPSIPQSVAVVTSIESAAYGDFVKIMQARWPLAKLYVCNVQVQGEAAIGDLVAGIQAINQAAPFCDVLVITRGGGSADDLAVFNDERVVRAVAASRVPTVVAVGHERDVTLAELAADQRASTPSNAAELISPDISEHRAFLQQSRLSLQSNVLRTAQNERLRLQSSKEALGRAVSQVLAEKRRELTSMATILHAYDPQAALARGYAMVTALDGALVTSIHQVSAGNEISASVSDGSIIATVVNTKPSKQ